MTRREYFEDRHEELRESGLCVDCGDYPVETWETLCPGCKHYRRRYIRWWKVVRPSGNGRLRPLRGNMSEDKANMVSEAHP